MRVISGIYKGKYLMSPSNNARPTLDNIKKTIFNILAVKEKIKGRVLDLFAGSGSLGIEALSNGCENAVFVDNDPLSIKALKTNIENCKITNAKYYLADFRLALKKMQGQAFDLIILDPPYDKGFEYHAVSYIMDNLLLDKNGMIFIEHSPKNELINLQEHFIIDTRICKNVAVSFLQPKA